MKNFTFKALVFVFSVFLAGNINGQDLIDLTGIDNANILVDTLPDIPGGAVVVLDAAMTYNAGGVAFDNSVTIKSSDPTGMMKPKIDCAVNFNFADGANIDSIVFINIEFFGEFDSRYILNSNVGATVGEFRLDGCYVHDLRGVMRMKDAGPGSLNRYTINNCVINRIRDYALLTVDRDDWMVNHILIKNSTISKVRAFITSRNNTQTVVIDGCTLNEVTSTGQRMFRWRTGGQDNVTEGITIRNTIWGGGWDEEGTGTAAIDGFDGLGATTWTVENTYTTSDLSFAEGKDTIFALLNKVYAGTAADLWTYPLEGEFHFLDTDFEGIGLAGDPRWGVSNVEGGLDWNFSDTAFVALGDLTADKTVLGLTIYADESKKVTVDGSQKTFEDMAFTHRLKFNGTGGFDDNGVPFGRVLAFPVNGNTNITVIGTSANSSEDRVLNIAAGSKDNIIAEYQALAGTITKGVFYYKGDPTVIYIYSANSGINLYYLKTAAVPTKVNELNASQPDVNIYPNPATSRVYVDYNRPVQVAIYNIAGSRLISKMVRNSMDYIDVSGLPAGVYLIRSQNDNTFARKLVKR